jgi:hypothetical protein
LLSAENTHPAFPPIKCPFTDPSLPVAAPHASEQQAVMEQFDDKYARSLSEIAAGEGIKIDNSG